MNDQPTPPLEEYRCGCCQGTAAQRWSRIHRDADGRPGRFELVQCQACGLVQLWPQPAHEVLTAYYHSDTYYAYRELSDRQTDTAPVDTDLRHRVQRLVLETSSCSGRRQQHDHFKRWLVAPIRHRFGGVPWHEPNGSLLDLGCGDGTFLFELQRLGWTVAGMEMDKRAVQNAQRHGLDVRLGTIDNIPFPSGSFGIVRMWHVLEHLRDPQAALAAVRRLLRPGGEVILGVPNLSCASRWCFGEHWCGWNLPRHLHHFTVKTIKRLLEEAGFDVQAVRCHSVGTSYYSFTTRYPSLTHPLIRAAFVLADGPIDLLGLGDSLDVRAVFNA